MSSRRRIFAWFALALSLALPLRGYASAGMQCSPAEVDSAMTSMHTHAMQGEAAFAGHDAAHHHDPATHADSLHAAHTACSVCCCAAAIGIEEYQWRAQCDALVPPPLLTVPPTPTVILDGLERPPRTFFG